MLLQRNGFKEARRLVQDIMADKEQSCNPHRVDPPSPSAWRGHSQIWKQDPQEPVVRTTEVAKKSDKMAKRIPLQLLSHSAHLGKFIGKPWG